MIEVIYKEDKEDQGTVQEPFSMPRNVRQIGLANGDYRIYIEDYVYTFLCSLAEDGETESQGNVAVLTGEIQWTTDMTCIYVKGALAADGMEATAEHIDFSEKIWQKIQDDKEQYFQEQEIVGWFFAQPQIAIEVTELLVKVHLRHFGGEKILMLMDPGEREDAFFRYDGGTMAKLTGYYIYYEKNSQMQTYMIERSQREGGKASEKVEDKAVRNFRKIIDSKKPEEREEKTSVFLCGHSVSGAGSSGSWCESLPESAGEKRSSGRLSCDFRFGGADNAGDNGRNSCPGDSNPDAFCESRKQGENHSNPGRRS